MAYAAIVSAKLAYNLPWIMSDRMHVYQSSYDCKEAFMIYLWARGHHQLRLLPLRNALRHHRKMLGRVYGGERIAKIDRALRFVERMLATS